MIYARYERDGLPFRERMLSNVDLFGQVGCAVPWLANAAADFRLSARFMEKTLGISAKRPLPQYARGTIRPLVCQAARTKNGGDSGRAAKCIILWDDTFVRYHEPHIGIAAVKVLEALGFEVELCEIENVAGGPLSAREIWTTRPDSASTKSRTSYASTLSTPILFLEPSCYSMFVEDYRELKIAESRTNCGSAVFSSRSLSKICSSASRTRSHLTSDKRTLRFTRIATPSRCSTRVHGALGRAIAWAESDLTRDRLLRNGRRVRRAGNQNTSCRSKSEPISCRKSKRSPPTPRGCFGHELPASNRTYDLDSSEAHRGGVGRRDCLRRNEAAPAFALFLVLLPKVDGVRVERVRSANKFGAAFQRSLLREGEG